MKHTPARVRTAALGTTALVAPLLVLAGPSTQAAVTGSATVSATYTCSNNLTADTYEMPLDLDITAAPSGTATRLTVAGGRTTLDDSLTVSRISSTLTATAGGTATQLTGSASNLVITAGKPFTLPSLTGTVAAAGTSLVFTPGAFTMSLTVSLFTVKLSCAVRGTAPSVTIGTTPTLPTTPPVTATPSPTAKPTPPVLLAARKARVTAVLAKRTVRVGGKRARVSVRVLRRSTAYSQPSGTVKVAVRGRTVATKKVAAGRTVTLSLPKRLKTGRHSVTVAFTPSRTSHAAGHRASSAKVVLRVKR